MNVLLTNSEGDGSRGILSLRGALIAAGFNVLTVAPALSAPRMSRAISDRTAMRMERAGDDDCHPIYRVHGTAADCVRVPILSGMARNIAAVVSGIAEEANIGDDASYSSTFGAAAEAAILGYPAMALSQQAHSSVSGCDGAHEQDFSWSCAVGAELTAWLAASPPPERSILNVNIPARLTGRHLKLTSLSERIWEPLDWEQAETGVDDGWLIHPAAYRSSRFVEEAGSDASAIANGHVSVTPISLDQGSVKAAVRLRAWTRRIIQAADPRLGASDGACAAGCCG